jgi:GNAT superfamily N-acetyltransferase
VTGRDDAQTSGAGLRIGAYQPRDEEELFAAYTAVVDEGGAFPRRAPATRDMFRAAWLDGASIVHVARIDDRFAGSYYLKPNFPGAAAHIANAGYVVPTELRGRGIGRALAEHSLLEARRLGFDAMMFNLVFERNPSRRLWDSLGFIELGRIPDAVDGQAAIIYWRSLG